MLNVSFHKKGIEKASVVAVLVNDSLKMSQEMMDFDNSHQGLISKVLEKSEGFKGKFCTVKSVTSAGNDGNLIKIIIIGTGPEDKLNSSKIEQIGGKIHSQASAMRAKNVSIHVQNSIGLFQPEEVAALLASGGLLASYRFEKYHTKKTDDEKFITSEFHFYLNQTSEAEKIFAEKSAIALGVFLARDCVTEVPNVLYPETYAEIIATKLEPLGVDVNVIGEREMRDLGMGALLGVGQGSTKESKMVVMEYNGADSQEAPVCFIGKGVTFDTGGISIKPALNMGDMKYDMAGSAAVVGAIKALALRGAKVNVVGIVGLVENMPSGEAQRPGDVVKSMSGKTVEVLNTDAEGRLVLCDCVTYAQTKFKPACIVDLATLTGAIIMALGHTYAGCFANDDELANNLINAGQETDEKLWRMPLHQDYDDMIKSPIADIANIGSEGGAAGSATAAHFIGRFIEEGVKWAHLDIAGVAWDKKGVGNIYPKGAVGFGVRLLNKFVQDNYESK